MNKNLKITTEYLQSLTACQDGIDWVAKYGDKEPVAVIRQLVADDKLDWANWLIVRIMDYRKYTSYAVFTALQVIDNFEKLYPDDKRPRQAIEAAQKCIDDPTEENKSAARSAADSAYSTAYSAYSAYSTAYSAYSAYSAAYSAADSAYSAAYSAADSAYSAARSDADSAMIIKIIEYGISLLDKEDTKN